MGILQRGGKVFCKVVENTSYKQLTPPVLCKVKHSATIYSDEWHGSRLIWNTYKNHIVDHGHGIYVSGGAYRNTIEAFWGNYCKRAINDIYNWVSCKHMQRCFDEFCFRYNTRNVSINERFAEAILQCKSRLTYNKLTA